MDGVLRRQVVRGDGVPRLMEGGQAALMLRHDAAVLFRACNDLDHRILHILHHDDAAAALSRKQSRLVQQVRKVCAGEAGGRLGNDAEIDIVRQRLVLGVDLEDLLAAAPVGRAVIDLPVKASRAQKCRVEDVLSVGGCEDDHALILAEAVHLHKQLVERLLALVVSSAETRAAAAADGVDLVNKDDAGRNALCLVEQVSHAAGADADIQLDKIRAGNGQKRHARLAGDGTRQQRLAGSRRADQQHALRHTRAHLLKALGIAEELHDLLKLRLFLVCARHIGKGDLFLARNAEVGVGARELRHCRRPAVCAVHQEKPHHQQTHAQQRIRQDRPVPRCAGRLRIVVGCQNAASRSLWKISVSPMLAVAVFVSSPSARSVSVSVPS